MIFVLYLRFNASVNEETFESEKIHAAGLVVGDYCDNYSHWNADKSLSQWLVESDVPGITGIDTRRLTKILREKGSMLAKV
jgi:carbamoylphosphate synthase small subunit